MFEKKTRMTKECKKNGPAKNATPSLLPTTLKNNGSLSKISKK